MLGIFCRVLGGQKAYVGPVSRLGAWFRKSIGLSGFFALSIGCNTTSDSSRRSERRSLGFVLSGFGSLCEVGAGGGGIGVVAVLVRG